jgi:hypothetical protein
MKNKPKLVLVRGSRPAFSAPWEIGKLDSRHSVRATLPFRNGWGSASRRWQSRARTKRL